jgi:hypothetical protein
VWVLRGIALLAALYVALLIPDREPAAAQGAGQSPFVWERDAFWAELEQQFVNARGAGCDPLADSITLRFQNTRDLLSVLGGKLLSPQSAEWDQLETGLFELAPLAAACPERTSDYIELATRARSLIKQHSAGWDMNSLSTRQRLYRMLFGTRMAIEEVMRQSRTSDWPTVSSVSRS